MNQRMKNQIAATTVGVALLALPSIAKAENKAEIGGFGGYHIFNKNNELGTYEGAENEINDAFVFGVRVAYNFIRYFSTEGELGIVSTKIDETGDDVTNLAWRLQLVAPLLPGKFKPFVLVGVGGSTAMSSNTLALRNDTDFVPHAGVGSKFAVQDNWGIRADARVLFPPSTQSDGLTTDWEFTLALYKTFDQPSAPPAPAKVVDEAPICPEGQMLGDKGECQPILAEINCEGSTDTTLCPDAKPAVDPNDKCPDQEEDKDGFQDEDGCLDPDNDSDGIADADDKCPEAETVNGFQDQDGCPDEVPAQVQAFTGAIKGIQFGNGAATVKAASKKTLDEAAKVLTEFPDLRVEISGHTDDAGKRDANVALSTKRAEAVKAYLVSKGIAEARIVAVGHGPDMPIGDNKTKQGKAQNRRIEFKLIGP